MSWEEKSQGRTATCVSQPPPPPSLFIVSIQRQAERRKDYNHKCTQSDCRRSAGLRRSTPSELSPSPSCPVPERSEAAHTATLPLSRVSVDSVLAACGLPPPLFVRPVHPPAMHVVSRHPGSRQWEEGGRARSCSMGSPGNAAARCVHLSISSLHTHARFQSSPIYTLVSLRR